MTIEQWRVAAEVVAELCERYAIEVTPRTVLAHGEVQETLGIAQLGKWDPLVQPWSPSTLRQQVMDEFRAAVREHQARGRSVTLTAAAVAGAPSAFRTETQDWTGDSAILLVHGVGNATVGDYTDVVAAVRSAVGPDVAVYTLLYDVFNDWLREKTEFAGQIGQLTALLKANDPDLPDTIAEFAGDVIWPLFSLSARTIVQTAYRAQLRQMVLDGMRSTGKLPGELRFSIICHSLGCFHTYEVLHSIATDTTLNLRPITDGVRFRGVVFMASPVQLIRTFAGAAGGIVPGTLATAHAKLAIPVETALGMTRKSAARCVTVTGDLDPIGGHFLRNKADWAFMHIDDPDVSSHIDVQALIGSGDERASLLALLSSALRLNDAPKLSIDNPHSWLGYIERHKGELMTWLD